ncbi:MAG: hypothetical protein R2707_18295 [Acidimicrobiales bacterium]
MTDEASDIARGTARSTIPPEVLDALVPAPAARWRRAALWLLFAAAVAGVGWGWSTGIANPEISTHLASWGGDGPVHLGFRVESRSAVDIEITEGFDVPDGLRLLGYTTAPFSDELGIADIDGGVFPVRVRPDGPVDITAFFEITDCGLLANQVGPARVTVAIADGPFSWFEHRRVVGTDFFAASDATGQGAWPTAISEGACVSSE